MHNEIKINASKTSKVTNRTVSILETLANVTDERGYTVKEISKLLNIDRSAIYRVLNSLVEVGYIHKTGSCYYLSLKLFTLASRSVVRYGIRQKARPHLVHLAETTVERAFLSVRENYDVVQLDFAEGNSNVRLVTEIGSRFPLYASASGKVFLAEMSKADFDIYLEQTPLIKLAPKTITDKDELVKNVEEVKEKGYGWADEEFTQHERGLSIPIRSADGTILATIGVVGTVLTFKKDNIPSILKLLHATARKLKI